MKELYPGIEPFHSFFLETEGDHSVYVEQCGNPEGVPVVFLHGGPCSGCRAEHRLFFNPDLYHIILFDQRGCGRSTPFGKLGENSSYHLMLDMDAIRKRLNIKKWLLFGGSWGGTLALLFAQNYPVNVSGLILRGVFLARKKDLDWFAREGVTRIYPEAWQNLLDSTEADTGPDMINRLHACLWDSDQTLQLQAAKAWIQWEAQVTLGPEYRADEQDEKEARALIKQVRMELHYAHNRYFVDENELLDNCDKLQGMPVKIIHGRNDLVCPVESGYSLHKALPGSEFIVLPDSGHIAGGEEMIDALVNATDEMAACLK